MIFFREIKYLAEAFFSSATVNLHRLAKKKKKVFSGNYSSWSEAKLQTTGYDDETILDKVKTALLKVKNKEAVYERDSVLLDKIEYSWPLLAGLLWTAARYDGSLNVLDFGGSLGSTYFQNRFFLRDLAGVKWNIVEQERFVSCGKKYFEDEHIRFYYTLEECLANNPVNLILLSSVIQYLEKPYKLLEQVVASGVSTVIFDRTPFIEGNDDLLTIQNVPETIYKASYPCWFFNEKKFLSFFEGRYALYADTESPIDYRKLLDSRRKAAEKTLIFKIRG